MSINTSINNLVGTFATVNIESPELISNTNLLCIDTSNSRIGVNTLNPNYSIDIQNNGIINIPEQGLYVDGVQKEIQTNLSKDQRIKIENILNVIEVSGNNISFRHPTDSNNNNYFQLEFGDTSNSDFNITINSSNNLKLVINGLQTSSNSDSNNTLGVKRDRGYLMFNNSEDYQ